MAEEGDPPPVEGQLRAAQGSRRGLRWPKLLLQAVLGVFLLLALIVAIFNSPIGHRFVADRIAAYAPASGMRVTVGRIEGSLYGAAVLRDVTFADPKGVFLRVPRIELDWRPFNWFTKGLDVRRFVARRGTLTRLPRLNPGDPDAPLLPDFDIRADRFEIDNLTVARGVIGEQRRIDLVAKVDIRDGRALLRADGRFGGQDKLFALIDAAPASDRFDLALDYTAPAGGFLAGLTQAKRGVAMRLGGKGGWKRWDGFFVAREDGRDLAALRLGNRAGRYALHGLAWPGDRLSGLAARAAGKAVALKAEGTLVRSVLRGRLDLRGAALALHADGATNLDGNRFDQMRLSADLLDPALLGGDMRFEGARASAVLDGAFRDLTVDHALTIARARLGGYRIERVTEKGVATYDGNRWTIPLDLVVARVITGDAVADRRLVDGRATATLLLQGDRLTSDDIRIGIPGLAARLVLRGDLARGRYGLGGNAATRGFPVPNLGTADVDARLAAGLDDRGVWTLRTDFKGRMPRVTNDTLTTVAGTNLRFSGAVSLGSTRPLLIERARLDASKLTLAISGRRLANGAVTIAGGGRHADYGPFKVEASVAGDGPRAVLVFAHPYPAAGLTNVRVALAPIAEGFRIETGGGSSFGPFDGVLNLYARPGATRVEIERFKIWQTNVTGALALGGGAASGQLALAGGGVSGTVALAPRGGGQGLDVALTAANARFGGATPIAIRSATLRASGFFAKDRTTLEGDMMARGISIGSAFIGRMAAKANLDNGRGRVTASLAGRRGSRFNLQLLGDFEPGRIALLAQGDFAGRAIVMPRRAVLTRAGAGWQLAPSQINFGGGRMVAEGRFGGGATELRLALA
ncbi:MAG TPA: translocation/assembly module TamB, partial [Novosphingobium sp.]